MKKNKLVALDDDLLRYRVIKWSLLVLFVVSCSPPLHVALVPIAIMYAYCGISMHLLRLQNFTILHSASESD